MQRFHFDQIDSTSTQARRLAELHPGEVLLVTAASQSAGRGRHGRVWHSPRGGAWLSLVWPAQNDVRAYANVSLAVAVAVWRAINEVAVESSAALRIKWPNDLLVDDRKVAGILCEQLPRAAGADEAVLIVGIGVNVQFDPALFAPDLRHPATTLSAATGRPQDVEQVIGAVARHVVAVLEEFERQGLSHALLDDLQSHLAYVGTQRTWNTPRGAITGQVAGVDSAGRLLLRVGSREIACEVGEFSAPF